MDEAITPSKLALQSAQTLFHHIWPDQNRFDWTDEHRKKTPERFIKMMRELTSYPEPELTTFPSNSDEMVIVQDIDFTSVCAHHLVPFRGVAHVAYIPQGRLVGLSKIPRLVKYHAADLTVQEDLTQNIAKHLEAELDPIGVAVIMKAEHMCMTIRGVQAAGTLTTTSCMLGAFADHDKQARSEFLQLIRS